MYNMHHNVCKILKKILYYYVEESQLMTSTIHFPVSDSLFEVRLRASYYHFIKVDLYCNP